MGIARSTYYDEPEISEATSTALVEADLAAICAEFEAYG